MFSGVLISSSTWYSTFGYQIVAVYMLANLAILLSHAIHIAITHFISEVSKLTFLPPQELFFIKRY